MPNATSNAQRFATPGYDLFQAVFTSAFRDYVGTYDSGGKFITVAGMASALGKKDTRTVESWRDGESNPRGSDLFAVMAVLPPGFTNRLLSIVGLGGAQALMGEGIDLHVLASDTANYLALHANHMKDGRIDHRERVIQERKLRLMRDQIDLYFAGQVGESPDGLNTDFAGNVMNIAGGK